MTISKRDINKQAWDIGDIPGEFAKNIALDIAGGSGLALLAGAGLAGVGAAALSGLGVGALIFSLGLAIYEVTKVADDNIADLIDRLEDLDYEGTLAEQIIGGKPDPDALDPESAEKVGGWLQNLQKLQSVFQLAMPSGTDEEKAKALADKVSAMQKGLEYLEQMWAFWPQVKAKLGDRFWERDIPQFEKALKQTILSYRQLLQSTDAQAKAALQKGQAAQPEQKFSKKSEFHQLMGEITSLNAQIRSLWSDPQYTPEELKLIQSGKQLWSVPETELTPEVLKQMEALKPGLIKLTSELRWLLSEVKKRKKGASDFKPAISKRAVSLPGIAAPPAGVGQMQGAKPGAGVRKMPVVETLQQYINHMKVAFDVEAPYLEVDGQYGTQTANALIAVLNKFPKLGEYFKAQGVPLDKLNDARFMNSDAGGLRFINFITSGLGQVIKYYTAEGEKQAPGISQRDTPAAAQPAGAQCNWNTLNPTSLDMLNCLKAITDPRVNNMSMYDYMKTLQMNDQDMVIFIHDQFGGYRPKTWSSEAILRALQQRKPQEQPSGQ